MQESALGIAGAGFLSCACREDKARHSSQHSEPQPLGPPQPTCSPLSLLPCILSCSMMYGDQARFFDDEKQPHLKHRVRGVVGMASPMPNANASQFYITTGGVWGLGIKGLGALCCLLF